MEVIKSHRKRNIMSGIALAFSYLFTTGLSESRPSLTSESKMQSYFFDSDYYIHTPVKFLKRYQSNSYETYRSGYGDLR